MTDSVFCFSIKPCPEGWAWTTRSGDDGRALARGRARTRAEAAALVVRFIARAIHPGAVPPVPQTARCTA